MLGEPSTATRPSPRQRRDRPLGSHDRLIRAPDQPHADRLEWIVRNLRHAEFAVAVGTYDAAPEKGALVDDSELIIDIGRQEYCESCQGQALATRATELAIGNPRGLAAVWAQSLELDVACRQGLDRADAERLDTQLAAAVARPASTWKVLVSEALHVEDDFGRNF